MSPKKPKPLAAGRGRKGGSRRGAHKKGAHNFEPTSKKIAWPKDDGSCQNCDNMDPEAFEYDLFCSMIAIVDPETKLKRLKPFRLYARKTCSKCETFLRTIDSEAMNKAIGI